MDSGDAKTNEIELADLHIDLGSRSVSRNGDALAVTARSFELLKFLIASHPRIASAREIIAGVWPGSVVSGDALTQRVKLLRRQLGCDGKRYISSAHGIGYRLAVAPKPCLVRETGRSSATERSRRCPARQLLLTAALAAALVGVVAGGLLVYAPPHALKHAVKHQLWAAHAR